MRLTSPFTYLALLAGLALTFLACGDDADTDADASADHGDLDPCRGLPRCSPPGTTCVGDTLVVCAMNADGCLVETYQDCTTLEDGYCDDTQVPARCVEGGLDPCRDKVLCEEEGRECDGDTLVICALDTEGCLVETEVDCTDLPQFEFGGYCDDTLDPVACAGLPDPCQGLENLCEVPERHCEENILVVCAADEFGCLVETEADCTDTDQVCNPLAEPAPACVDPCSLIDTCPAPSYCEEHILVTCVEDADGCLVPDTEVDCLEERLLCDDQIDPPDCVPRDTCPEAMAIDCLSGTVTANTGDTDTNNPPYATHRLTGYSCTSGIYNGNEFLFIFTSDRAAYVTALSTRLGTAGDFDLFALSAADAYCAEDTLLCLDSSLGTGATEVVDFNVMPGEYVFLVYDIYSTSASSITTEFTLEIECRICGDGILTAPEICDDANGRGGDGCSTLCTVEEGYICTGSPSVCHPIECGDGIIEGDEECDDDNTSNLDGCSLECLVENGWSCRNEPSDCQQWECGNGVIDPSEECDDDDTDSLDGCSSSCHIESGWVCLGEPSFCASGGDTCEQAIPLTAGSFQLNNTGFVNNYTGYTGGSCGSYRTGAGPDMVFSIAVPGRNLLQVEMDGSPSSMDEVAALVSSCTNLVNSCLAYGDDPTAVVQYFNPSTGPVTVYLVADGYLSSSAGLFDLDVTFTPVICGDGVVERDEQCDDGPGTPTGGDGCSQTCTFEDGWVCEGQPSVCREIECGDGLVEGNEQCDLGVEENDDFGLCTTSCIWAACGDGFVNTPYVHETLYSPVVTNPFGVSGHVCDDFSDCAYLTDCDVSTDGSAPEHGICQALGFQRALTVTWGDGEGGYDAAQLHAYNWSCTDFVCGPSDDGDTSNDCYSSEMLYSITCVAIGEEQCDEGEDNSNEPDAASGCRTDCTPVRCGDHIQDTGEECDDGNDIDDDGCSNECENPICGDSIIQTDGGEQCDVGGTPPWPGCDEECQVITGWRCFDMPSVCVQGGNHCGEPIDLSPWLNEGRTSFTFDTSSYTNQSDGYAGQCGTDRAGAGPDMVFSLHIDAHQAVEISSDATWNEVLVLADTCLVPFSDYCLLYTADGFVGTHNDTDTALDLFLVVDGVTATDKGAFDIEISFIDVVCGDGEVTTYEECDDGPGTPADGDGCSAACIIEEGWSCDGSPSDCHEITCGDGLIEGDEECDDGPGTPAAEDGCSLDCLVETGWACRNEPSQCHLIDCGDGFIDEGEDCDDDNELSDDGCSSSCEVETGYVCTGEPSDCIAGSLGDTCATAIRLTPGTYNYDTTEMTRDYTDYEGPCAEMGSSGYAAGPDMVFVVNVPAGSSLTASMTTVDDFDAVLAVASACPDILTSCITLSDSAYSTGTETVTVTNSTGSAADYYIVADGYYSTSTSGYGPFSLTLTID
ncbi:MAG: DUF4215 domain-containing protein [Bradymonadales bacterium]|nr:DUF4215 domain-containing protein [Bradymonadales bacterium]